MRPRKTNDSETPCDVVVFGLPCSHGLVARDVMHTVFSRMCSVCSLERHGRTVSSRSAKDGICRGSVSACHPSRRSLRVSVRPATVQWHAAGAVRKFPPRPVCRYGLHTCACDVTRSEEITCRCDARVRPFRRNVMPQPCLNMSDTAPCRQESCQFLAPPRRLDAPSW